MCDRYSKWAGEKAGSVASPTPSKLFYRTYQSYGDLCNSMLSYHQISWQCGAMLRTELMILVHCAPVAVWCLALHCRGHHARRQ